MSTTTAGIFFINCQLLSSSYYLCQINQILLNYYQKYPEAYFTIVLFNTTPTCTLLFEKTFNIPILEIETTNHRQCALFDCLIETIEKIYPLFPIYEITKVHCFIACLTKDTASQKNRFQDYQNLLNFLQTRGWHIYHFEA